jgi:hypothetical protein
VPLNYNDSSEVEDWKLVEVERNLFEKFRGLTCFPTNLPLRGLWTKGELVYQDKIILYMVIDFSASEENLSFMQQYKDVLKERFRQEEILITSQVIEVL